MSCEGCSEQQASGNSAFFRWGNANLEVRGCEAHLKEVFGVLRGHLQEATVINAGDGLSLR